MSIKNKELNVKQLLIIFTNLIITSLITTFMLWSNKWIFFIWKILSSIMIITWIYKKVNIKVTKIVENYYWNKEFEEYFL
ncbi:MAG: 4-hydroxybenzoate polyprenyltransferase, mitochondrial [Mycoplasmataceae bacterium]|nr:MAG: 4-hydroxybenzoate polyprenyltransferase, mitochondrial [Mycoplasmataceae bacterium]